MNAALKVLKKKPSMMSKRERLHFILSELKIPSYLHKHLATEDSPAKADFNHYLKKMSEGKIEIDINLLRDLMDTVDRERYATPK